MKPAYRDILTRIQDEPRWWTDGGVPRFEPFTPTMLGVYDCLALLVKIACQSCHRHFDVAVGWSWPDSIVIAGHLASGATGGGGDAVSYHYGDPPRHDTVEGGRLGGCVGETMSCWNLRIIEAWAHEDFGEWARQPEWEIPLEQESFEAGG